MINEANINSARAAQQGMRRAGPSPDRRKSLNDIFVSPFSIKTSEKQKNYSGLDESIPMTEFTQANADALGNYKQKYRAERTSGPMEFGDKWGGEIGSAIGGFFGPIGRMGGRMIGTEAGGEIAQGFDDVFHEAPSVFEDAVRETGGFVKDLFGGGGGGGGGWKVVCTAMNHHYGFGKFRQTIWLQHSANLHPAYEKGYHTLFLPLVKLAYKKQIPVVSKLTQSILEHIARHRTIDVRAEMRNSKRALLGRFYRVILEPLCFIVGKWKLKNEFK